MLGGYFYFDGTDGRHYCWAKQPTYVCPMAEPTEYVPAPDGEDGEHVLRPATFDAVRDAASALGMDWLKLGLIIKRVHGSHLYGRARVNGKLTDDCAICGHRMDRRGFRIWIEETPTEEDAQSRIAGRLGFSNMRTVPGSSRYLDTKKEAKQWAWDESRMVRS